MGSTNSSAKNKGSSKASKDLHVNSKQFAAAHTVHEHGTTCTTVQSGGMEGTAAAVHIKQEGGVAGQSSKYTSVSTATTPHSGSPGNQGSTTDTPLTHFRVGGKPTTAAAFVTSSPSLSGQRATCSLGGGGGVGSESSGGSSHHPLVASSTMAAGSATKSEGQSSAQNGSTGKNSHVHVRTKGPVTRSTAVRACSPSACGDVLPMVSGSPPEKIAKSAEKPQPGGGGLSCEEARKLRQAQQKLQKEQWMKKYGHGTKRTLEMQQDGGAGGSGSSSTSEDGGGGQGPQANSDTGAGQPMENGVLISDGTLMVQGYRVVKIHVRA